MFSSAVIEQIQNSFYVDKNLPGMYHISEAIERMRERFLKMQSMTEQEQHEFILKESINDYKRIEQRLEDEKDNHWIIYELCKRVHRIAQDLKVDFAGASFLDKLILVTTLIKDFHIDDEVIREGVLEFHESGWCVG